MRLLILDRDGVINRDRDDYVKSAAEFEPLPGALPAIARAGRAGWRIVLATNQSGLGRGLFDMDAFTAMQRKLDELLAAEGGRIDAVFYCPHTPEDDCECRKPRTGLLEQIARRYGIELAGVPFIGDTHKDIQAARAAGARPVLVRTGKGRRTETGLAPRDRPEVHDDLAAAIDALLAETQD